MRTTSGLLLKGFLCTVIVGSAYLAASSPARADPGISTDPVAGLAPGTIYEPAPGAPVNGPTVPPPMIVIPDLLNAFPPFPFAPGAGDIDDFSYGNDPIVAPLWFEFSTGPSFFGPTTGHLAAPPPPPPLFDVRREAGLIGAPPFGDGVPNADVYITYPGPLAGPLGCGIVGSNAQILDGNGTPGGPYGPPRLGLNLAEPPTNLDGYERSDNRFVDVLPPFGVPERPVFFTISPATAAAWPGALPLPGPAGPALPGPSDVLAYNPASGSLVIWALAVTLGLMPGDDIDALSVTWSGTPLLPAGFGPGDTVIFSLAPGSPSLSPTSGGGSVTPLAPLCFPPGTGTAADVWFDPGVALPPGGATPLFNAEMFGLNSARSGGALDDNLDAIDICQGAPLGDTDGDTINDRCDFDRNGNGIGNLLDSVGGVAAPLGPEAPQQAATSSGRIPAARVVWPLVALTGVAGVACGGWIVRRTGFWRGSGSRAR